MSMHITFSGKGLAPTATILRRQAHERRLYAARKTTSPVHARIALAGAARDEARAEALDRATHLATWTSPVSPGTDAAA